MIDVPGNTQTQKLGACNDGQTAVCLFFKLETDMANALATTAFVLASAVHLAYAGHTVSSITLLLDAIRTVFGSSQRFQGLKMLDFGNQEIFDICTYLPDEQRFGFQCFLPDLELAGPRYPIFTRYGYTASSFAVKPLFEHLGFEHVSVDLNGKQGALALDARKDLTLNITNRFDIVVNNGFSEHVGEGDVSSIHR